MRIVFFNHRWTISSSISVDGTSFFEDICISINVFRCCLKCGIVIITLIHCLLRHNTCCIIRIFNFGFFRFIFRDYTFFFSFNCLITFFFHFTIVDVFIQIFKAIVRIFVSFKIFSYFNNIFSFSIFEFFTLFSLLCLRGTDIFIIIVRVFFAFIWKLNLIPFLSTPCLDLLNWFFFYLKTTL